jgi:hypothetical protein
VIRRGAALAAILLFVPAPAYAHAVGPGAGVEIELLMVAGVLLVGGFKLRSTPDRFTAGNVLITLGALGVAAALVIPNLGSTEPQATSARISIVSPSDGEELDAGTIAVEVDVRNGPIAASADDEGGHIHIFVDDAMVSMPNAEQSTIELEPGEHSITVEYVGSDHESFDPPVTDTITVEAS